MAESTGRRSLDGFAELIANQNPYTSGQVDDMDLYIWPPNPDDPNGDQGSQIELELDADYPGEWNFKGVAPEAQQGAAHQVPLQGPQGRR